MGVYARTGSAADGVGTGFRGMDCAVGEIDVFRAVVASELMATGLRRMTGVAMGCEA